MKLLVIISSHEMVLENLQYITILNNLLKEDERVTSVDYCGISGKDDFHNFESVVEFKYKMISDKRQLSKICDFISQYKEELLQEKYDWYIKTRTDMKLMQSIPFEILSKDAINARARVYEGSRNIKYGRSVGGEGCWKHVGCCSYNEEKEDVVLDDMLYIFHENVIRKGAFDVITFYSIEHEWIHTNVWKGRNIGLNVIGLNMSNMKHSCVSGDIHFPEKENQDDF
jgi:hypothetical protein